jgi:hypothetical protein
VNGKLLEAGEGMAKLLTNPWFAWSSGCERERDRETETEKWVAGTVSVGRDGGRERRSSRVNGLLGLGWRSVACGGLRGPNSVGDGLRAPFVRGRCSAGSRVEIGGLRWSKRVG